MKKLFANTICTLIVAFFASSLCVFAQSEEIEKPESMDYSWADAYATGIYGLRVEVRNTRLKVENAHRYIAEFAQNPAVFIKDKTMTDYRSIVKTANSTIAPISEANVAGVISAIKNLKDKTTKDLLLKNLSTALEEITSVPGTLQDLGKKSAEIATQTAGVMAQASDLGMFKRAGVTSKLVNHTKSLESATSDIKTIAESSVSTLDLYKKILTGSKK
jgi:hypothetical protein